MSELCPKCEKSDPPVDDIKCSVCSQRFHAACTRLQKLEAWTKKAYADREVWKCDLCKISASNVPDANTPVPLWYSNLLLDLNRFRTDFQSFRTESNEMKTTLSSYEAEVTRLKQDNVALRKSVTTLETQIQAFRASQLGVHQNLPFDFKFDHKVEQSDKIPTYMENEISKVPKLYTDNPWSLIKFLEKLHLLNGMKENSFKSIFQRIATFQGNSILLRIATEQVITFQTVARTLLDELTTPHTKLNLVQDKILRPQYPNENFRTYVEQVTKFNDILSQYSEVDIVKSILQGTSTNTRAKFQFNTRPQTMADLQHLVADVEKLELTENLQRAKAKKQNGRNSQSKPNNYHYTNDDRRENPDSPNDSQSIPQQSRQNSPPAHHHQKRNNNNNNNQRTFNKSEGNNSNQSNRQSQNKSNFKQNNPNYNKTFNRAFMQPFVTQQPYGSYMSYPPFPYLPPGGPNMWNFPPPEGATGPSNAQGSAKCPGPNNNNKNKNSQQKSSCDNSPKNSKN